MKENKKITEVELQKISEWLKNSTVSDFKNRATEKNLTEKFIGNMVIVNSNQVKEPYTL